MEKERIELGPGDELELTVHGQFLEEPIVYRIQTPSWGQDDGWGGTFLVECVRGVLGRPDTVDAVGADDAHQADFGDPDQDHRIERANIIRVANSTQ